MAVEVIFNCNATVQQYNPATREFEYLKFRDVSTVTILCLTDQMNVQARPIYKMAVAAGRDHVVRKHTYEADKEFSFHIGLMLCLCGNALLCAAGHSHLFYAH